MIDAGKDFCPNWFRMLKNEVLPTIGPSTPQGGCLYIDPSFVYPHQIVALVCLAFKRMYREAPDLRDQSKHEVSVHLHVQLPTLSRYLSTWF